MPILAVARNAKLPVKPTVEIPRIERRRWMIFLDMKPNPAMEGTLTRVTGFAQSLVCDGEHVSQRTRAYVGYDVHKSCAILVFVISNPNQLRARVTTREDFRGDDLTRRRFSACSG